MQWWSSPSKYESAHIIDEFVHRHCQLLIIFKNSQNNNQIWCLETFLVWRNSKLGPRYTSSNCPLDTRGCHSRIVNLCICLFVCLCILRQTKLGAWGGYVNRMGWLQELLTKRKTRPQRLSHFKTTLKPELFGTCGLQNQFWTNL